MARPRPSTAVECAVCAKIISRKADLARHMKTHAANREELMHTCPHVGCNYKTLQRSNLATHLNVHSRERPNKCPTDSCGFSTSDPGSLTRHRKEVHGYDPKANSSGHPSAVTRKEARRQRRISPYPSSSSSSTSPGSTARSVTLLDPSSETPRTPSLEVPHILSQSTPSSPPTGRRMDGQNIKNIFAAYSTELITKLQQLGAANPHSPSFLPLRLGLTTALETPAVECSQQPVPGLVQQGDLYGVRLPAQTFPEMTFNEVTSAMFENFLSQFDDLHRKAASSTFDSSRTVPAVQLAAYDAPAPIPPPLSSYEVHQRGISDVQLPPPATLPSFEDVFATDNALSYELYDPSEAASFDAQFSQLFSFSAADANSYPQAFYPQVVDQTHLYAAPVWMSSLQMQEPYLY